MQKNWIILAIILLSLFTTGCSEFERLRKSNDLPKKVKAAFEYYDQKRYYRADILFEEVLPLIQGAPEAEKGTFYHAYCKYYLGDYVLSKYQFQKFYETYARSQFAEEAMYMSAVSLYADSPIYTLDQTNTIEAIGALQNFINTYPNSKYVEESTNLINELRVKLEKKAFEAALLYSRTGNHKAALVAFNNFQRGYPDSDYNEEVAFRKVESAYLLAEQSIQSKQVERYQEAISSYESFLDRYPQSKFLRRAETYYEKSLNTVGEANKNLQTQKAQEQ
ncbi:outer membrane protein assembly factor BamD [Xanthocytophaga agilis]|uniref:Outer membrane protein assembly factor BamD n=1 Tax=Xanthocytophaga agilis TaxID=3048010 RepID=A0AAE3QZE7_9BACT|nr:outer membrane protein assembly factor BamD [Xanthocytophaga agilis]MDJ1500856.1 outer membrane protein assembly factor BamD [Xanthocytophaga agilis]